MSGDILDEVGEVVGDFFDEVYASLKKGATHVRRMVDEPRCAITISVDYDPALNEAPKVTKCGKPAKVRKLAESELSVAMCDMHAATINTK